MTTQSGKKKPAQRRAGKPLPPGAVSAWVKRIAALHPDVDAVMRMLPPRTYECERSAVPRADGLGFVLHSANPIADERMVELLRVLGRLYVADVRTLHRMLYYRRFHINTTYNDLNLLARQRLIWKVPAALSSESVARKRPVKPINVYGLSRAGHQLLADLGVESDDRALELLVKRDVTGRAAKPSSLAHDLQVSWWCASMVEGLRLIPWCTGIWCQTEYNAIKSQRADALLVARFDFSHPRPEPQQIPWFAGTPRRPGEIELRWALELDNSTESVNVLVNKFITYRDLHVNGTYQRMLGGDVLLVLVAQNLNRAAYLAAEFKRAWPGGWGVVSTPELANTTPFGALWGTYLHMITEQPTDLLGQVVRQVRADEGVLEIGFASVLSYAQWRAYLQLLLAGTPPQSRGALNRHMEQAQEAQHG